MIASDRWLFLLASSITKGASMADSPHNTNIPPSEPDSPNGYEVGYGKPPRHAQFRKGVSGHPAGRPKRPEGISIKEILDGNQRGKNGEVISRREAYVIALVNEAMRGNQKAFTKFMNLMERSGLIRREESKSPMVIHVPSRIMTDEEYERYKKGFLPGQNRVKDIQ
jgi:hypothetical protein